MRDEGRASEVSLWQRGVKFVRSFGPEASRDLIGILLDHLDVDAKAIEVVRSMLRGQLDAEIAVKDVGDLEHRGDELRSHLVTVLTHALVTPIDREDIYRLSRSIDDVLDGLRDFVTS